MTNFYSLRLPNRSGRVENISEVFRRRPRRKIVLLLLRNLGVISIKIKDAARLPVNRLERPLVVMITVAFESSTINRMRSRG